MTNRLKDGVVLMTEPRPVVNTYDQLMRWKEAGLHSRPVAIIPAYNGIRMEYRNGWYVYSPWENTDPNAHWAQCGKKHFNRFGTGGTSWRDAEKLALAAAMKWANEKYGPFNWVRNRVGDYVPAEINKMFPIPKRK